MLSSQNTGSDQGLFAWIKRDQEERQKHAEYLVRRATKDDSIFLHMLQALDQVQLTTKSAVMVKNLLRHKQLGKNWSAAQRSVAISIFYSTFMKEVK